MFSINLIADMEMYDTEKEMCDLFGEPFIKQSRTELKYHNPISSVRYPQSPVYRLIYINSVLHDYAASVTLTSYKREGNEIKYSFSVGSYYCKISEDNEVFSFFLSHENQLNEELKKNINQGSYYIFADFGRKKELYNLKIYSIRKSYQKFRYKYSPILKYLKNKENEKEFNITHAMLAESITNEDIVGSEGLPPRIKLFYQDLVDMGVEKNERQIPILHTSN